MPPSDRRSDKRRFPRRAKSIRFRFEHAGDQHFAVSTFVSLAGAYLKAAHVPRPGTLLSMTERFNADGVELCLRGEVMWVQDDATLERPETGFGLRFIELATRADPSYVEDFLKALDPTRNITEIEFEERANGAHAVYRFPVWELDPEAYREEEAGFGDFDDPVAMDLDRELDRLGREDARNSGGPVLDLAPPPLPPPPPQPEPSPAADTAARARSRKRSVTVIFTALFTRGRIDDLAVGEGVEATPAIAEATLIHDSRRPKILLSWQGGSVVARIESLGRESATLWTNDAAPERGQEVTLKPVGTGSAFELAIRARVLSREDRSRSGVSWLSIAFVKVDENGRSGRFQEYLRYVNGPGADER
jgi:hypothetical protein